MVDFDFQMCLWEALMYARPELMEIMKIALPVISVYHDTKNHKYGMEVAYLDVQSKQLRTYPCHMDVIPAGDIPDWLTRFKQRIDKEREDAEFERL